MLLMAHKAGRAGLLTQLIHQNNQRRSLGDRKQWMLYHVRRSQHEAARAIVAFMSKVRGWAIF
jgi:predicted ATP-grasp superfamily ATP-dependent carboligase